MKRINFRFWFVRIANFLAGLLGGLFLIIAILMQINQERYNQDIYKEINSELLDGERHSYMPVIIFQAIRLFTDWESKTGRVGAAFNLEHRSQSYEIKDAYFAKCYLTEAEIDSIYNEIQMRLKSRR